MDEQRIERILRQGPPFRTGFVARPLDLSPTATSPALGRSHIVVFAAVLVLTLTLALGLAIGFGILRLPDDDTPLTLGAINDCMPAERTMSDDTLLIVDVHVDVNADPSTAQQLTLKEDGLVIIGPTYDTLTDDATGSSRRLSPVGVTMVMDAVERSGLTTPGCHIDLWASTDLRGLKVRSDEEPEALTDWGRYLGLLRTMSAAEAARADELVAKLEALDAWLPDDAWVDRTPRPSSSELWYVMIERVPPDWAYTYGRSEYAGQDPGTDAVVMPGGGRLLDVGTEFRDPDFEPLDPSRYPGVPQEDPGRRCATLTTAEAEALSDALDASGAVVENSAWWFYEAPDLVNVRIQPVGPDAECARWLTPATTTPSPDPARSPTPEPTDVNACDLVSEEHANDLLPLAARFPVEAAGGRQDMGAAYATCRYANPEGGDSITLLVRNGRVTDEEALHLAELWLGADAARSEIGEAAVWENGCARGEGAYCSAGAAVYVGRTFVVIDFGPTPIANAALLTRLVPIIAENLDRARE